MKRFQFLSGLCVVFATSFGTAFAGMQPGTIQKGQYTGGNTCIDQGHYYSPTGAAACYNNTCTNDPPPYQVPHGDTNNCGPMNNQACGNAWTETIDPPCNAWTTRTNPTGGMTFYDKTPHPETLTYGGVGSGNRKLSDDNGNSCSRNSWGTNHTPMQMTGNKVCDENSVQYYEGGADGVCNAASSTDYLITSYSQNGTKIVSTPTDGDSSCTLEGRYATPDDSGPSVSLNGISNVFSGDTENWCNLKKYRSEGFPSYNTSANPMLAGCEYYRTRGSHATPADRASDLLEGLSITTSDPSGISQIRVEIGSCDATYDFPTDINAILQSPGGQGTTSIYSDQGTVTIPYSANFSVRGSTHPGLLGKFGKSRLDQCLTEGRNFVRVTVKDNARSDSNATSYAPNQSVLDLSSSNQFVNVDQSGPKFRLSGTARDVAEASDGSQCFDNGINADGRWKNFHIGGNLETTDPWGADSGTSCGSCTVLTSTGVNCNSYKYKPADIHAKWVAPSGVNATTGIYTSYYCDGQSPMPNPNTCSWDCDAGYACTTSPAPSCICVFDPNNPSACSTTSYTPCTPGVCASAYTYDSASGLCVLGGGLFMLVDDPATSLDPYRARLSNNSANMRANLINANSNCAYTSLPNNLRYAPGGVYGPLTSLPPPLNGQVFPLQTVCRP